MSRYRFTLVFSVLTMMLIAASGCGIQSIPRSLNQVEAAQAEVTNLKPG